MPMLLTASEREMLLRPRTMKAANPGDEAIAAGARRARRESIQQENLERLRASLVIPITELPLLAGEVDSIAPVQLLAKRFA